MKSLHTSYLVLPHLSSANLYCHCCSVTKSCLTHWNPMDCSTPGFPVLHHLLLCSNSCPLSRCSIQPSRPLLPVFLPSIFPSIRDFLVCLLFASGGQSIGASALASDLPMNIQSWFPLGWTGWISLQSKGLSRVFSNTTVHKHHFFGSDMFDLIYLHFLLTVLSLTGYMFHRGRYFRLLLLVLCLQGLQYSWHI